ncbi:MULTISPECIES: zinc ribbon domain-containing protein [unclassified Thioalkalivibrio]|uniref:FmdB family zinc ribbon protein n=1 Tax=unclassified Thioalkalivibrio TaxID=2621013 RepID=UPI00035FB4E3|nr:MULTISPECIES: zinc ribbon domain-containing protein [unclassified Thioalkalivibrio]
MADSTVCGNCGETLTELGSTSVEKRQPCPRCGSTRRNFSVEITDSVTASASVTATVVTYPNALLTIARSLIDQGHFNISIVTLLMACEVAAERAFDAAYSAKNLETLGEAVDGLMNGHNLANDKHRKLYNALTGVELEGQYFWPRFKSASEKRNSIVHRGGHANKDEAEAALQAARELITYLKQI